jgi:hypothetical protein
MQLFCRARLLCGDVEAQKIAKAAAILPHLRLLPVVDGAVSGRVNF